MQGQIGRLGCEDCGGERSVISPAGQQPALSKPATTSTKGAIKTITTDSTMTIDLNTQWLINQYHNGPRKGMMFMIFCIHIGYVLDLQNLVLFCTSGSYKKTSGGIIFGPEEITGFATRVRPE